MIIDEETYLEHFGVKGMRWGVRNKTNRAFRPRGRSAKGDKKRKAAAVAGGIGGWVIGGRLASPVSKYSPIAGLAASGASAALGAKFAVDLVDRNRSKKLRDL